MKCSRKLRQSNLISKFSRHIQSDMAVVVTKMESLYPPTTTMRQRSLHLLQFLIRLNLDV